MKTYNELLAERDDAMREASGLAMSIWRSEFRNESPEFELCDSPTGVVTQIDNMFAGIRQQRDALAARIQTAERVEKLFGESPDLTFDDCKRLFSAEIAEIKAEAIEDANNKLNDLIRSRVGKDYAKFIENCFDEYANKIRNGEIK